MTTGCKSKVCPMCKVEKPFDKFSIDRQRKDGRKFYCKDCCHILAGSKTYAVREDLPEGFKRCSRCQEVKALSEYGTRKERSGNARPMCKECARKRMSNTCLADPHSYWARQTIYRHRKNGDTVLITPKELAEIAKGTVNCPICGVEIRWGLKNTRGPVPASPSWDRKYNGRRLSKDNTWIICNRCNTIKQNLPFPEFVEFCRRVVSKFGGDGL